MGRHTGHLQLPGGRAAPGDHRRFGIAVAVLEADRGVGARGNLDEHLARQRQRPAALLLVTGQHHREAQIVQHTRSLERLQGVEQHDITALHIGDARSAGGGLTQPLEPLERTVGLEDRVEVADQQEIGPVVIRGDRPRGPLGHQVSGALERRSVDPAYGKPQGLELPAEDLSNLPYAVEVERPAVDVDHLLEQCQGLLLVRLDVLGDLLLDHRWRGLTSGGKQHEGEKLCVHWGRYSCGISMATLSPYS